MRTRTHARTLRRFSSAACSRSTAWSCSTCLLSDGDDDDDDDTAVAAITAAAFGLWLAAALSALPPTTNCKLSDSPGEEATEEGAVVAVDSDGASAAASVVVVGVEPLLLLLWLWLSTTLLMRAGR